MDPATAVTTFALLAFLVERLTNGLVIALGYWPKWERLMEPRPLADPAILAFKERNRRVATFSLGAVMAVVGAWLLGVNVLGPLGLTGVEGTAGFIVTGLLVAAGADPIHELLRTRQRGRESAVPPTPLQVTGTLVLQQPTSGPVGVPLESGPTPDVRVT